MSYQVLARKWRPGSFQDMVGQSHVLKALVNALDQDRLHHAYLFTGTRGVGKTTLARILAKCLNCETGVSSRPCRECNACVSIDEGRFIDLIEVDAASRAKVEETRDLMENVQYSPTSGRYKVYLIDEIHMFSRHSFNALLKTLEEPPPHVKFLLATTEPKKLPVTILSRCLQFNLSHLNNEQIARQIEMILEQEAIEFDKTSVELIARGAAGSMRDALSLLDQAIAYGGGRLQDAQVRAMMGTVESADLVGLIQSLLDADAESLLANVEKIALQNPDFDALLSDLLSLLQKIAVIQVLPSDSSNPLKENHDLLNFANTMKKEDIQLYYQIGMLGRKDLYLAPDVKSGFEMIMIRMLAFRPLQANEVQNKTQVIKPVTANAATETQAAQEPRPVVEKQVQEEDHRGDESNTDAQTPSTGNNWKDIIDEMALVGLVKELAGNCILKSHTTDKLELALAPSQENLFSQNQKEQLAQAIKTLFGEHVKMVIVVEDSGNETPSETNARLEREKQKLAQQSINSDPVVKSLMDTFNATVDQDSIRLQ